MKKKAPPPPKEKPSKNEDDEEDADEPSIPVELQQLLLNIFRDTFPEVLTSDDRQQLLQDVKTALYERDFERAFGKREFLETYSIRWSPSRALCYQAVLVDVSEHLIELFPLCGLLLDEREDEFVLDSSLRAVCFGGGAAEVVAFGGFVRHLLDCGSSEIVTSQDTNLQEGISRLSVSDPAESINSLNQDGAKVEPTTTSVMQSSESTSPPPILDLVLVDSAQWGEVVHKLGSSLTSPPPISKYANAAAKAANTSLLQTKHITTSFLDENVLAMTVTQMSDLVGKAPILLTLLFTLNELYTSSISSTTKFLLNLTMAAKKGTLLLVVDSPGSYSETTVGESSKKYPMHWLLDHTLLDTAKTDDKAVWEKVVSDDSKWFRIPEELRYPISLENMRYQIHLYRRL